MVEFSSSVYIGSESLKGVPVTLLITKGTISPAEEIVVNIVGTSQSPVSAEGIYSIYNYNYVYACMGVQHLATYIRMKLDVSSYVAIYTFILLW